MRVLGTTQARTAGTKAVRRGRGGVFGLGQSESTLAADAPTTAAISSIATLLALQGMDEPEPVAERAVGHGHDLLDRLRGLQTDLLSGRLDRTALRDLAQATARGVPAGADPALARLVQDIEVRAAVELAKLDLALPEPRPVPLAEPMETTIARSSCLRAYRQAGPG